MSSRFILIFILLLIARPASSQPNRVWFWFSNCGPQQLALNVTFDGSSLYRANIPICQATRTSTKSHAERRNISFAFKPSRAIKWEGYRDDNPVTSAGHPLTIDLWEAGADPDDLLIGVSVSDSHQIYMNTIHIAYPDKPSSSEIATGLVVSMAPISAAK